MARIARKYYNASFFHTIIQGIEKQAIFNKEKYKNEFLKLLKQELQKSEIKLEAYCIMDNHAHFIFKINKIENLSVFMKKVNSIYARYYNYMKNGRVGYVFKDRFLSEPITSKNYLINCIKYIHNNPVKANMVKHCGDYKYSSYASYLKLLNSGKSNILGILSREEIQDICYNTNTKKICLDIDNTMQEIISSGIEEFVEKEQIELFNIFENRGVLINIIKYLKNIKKIKYVDIRNELNINKGAMEGILKIIRNGT